MTASTNVALPVEAAFNPLSVEEMAALHGRGVGNAERLCATWQTKGSFFSWRRCAEQTIGKCSEGIVNCKESEH